jgi:hypothetical protein
MTSSKRSFAFPLSLLGGFFRSVYRLPLGGFYSNA